MGIGDQLGGVLGNAGLDVSNIGEKAGSFGQGLITFIIIAIGIGIITYLLMGKKTYNKKIHIFEEINGQAVPVGEDSAMEMNLDHTSLKVFYLKKRKLYLPRPTRQVGKGHYWYFIRDDGEWINFSLANMNNELKELGTNYDHTDMRYGNAALKKLIEKNFKKTNWMKEYAHYIAFTALIIILGVVGWLILREAKTLIGALEQVTKNAADMIGTSEGLLKAVNNVCSGSGIVLVK